MMFGKKKRDMERMMTMMQNLQITSKASLKQYCILATQGDVDKAKKLYDFLIEGMEELPMFDPVRPTVMQNIKTTASDVLAFFKENGNELQQGIAIIRSMFSKGGDMATPIDATPLPPINE